MTSGQGKSVSSRVPCVRIRGIVRIRRIGRVTRATRVTHATRPNRNTRTTPPTRIPRSLSVAAEHRVQGGDQRLRGLRIELAVGMNTSTRSWTASAEFRAGR